MRGSRILAGVGAFVGVAALAGFLLPAHWEVQRSVTIQAPPEAIYPYVARLKSWPEWSPWTAARDPTYRVYFQGQEMGVGAASTWEGEEIGDGILTVTESDPSKGVRYDSTVWGGKFVSQGSMTFHPEAGATRVIWKNEGDLGSNPFKRYARLLVDGFLGPDLEKGLANLKRKVESSTGKP
jgi:hypothetical protein